VLISLLAALEISIEDGKKKLEEPLTSALSKAQLENMEKSSFPESLNSYAFRDDIDHYEG
jgi:hypothetical protein